MLIRNIALAGLVFSAAAGLALLTSPAKGQESRRVFEIRTYTTYPGRLDALKARFRDHTIAIFNKHEMTSIGYWVPQDAPRSQDTLIYILAHPSREAAAQHWKDFGNDPEWKKAQAESEADGKIVSHVDTYFADATDFSAIK